MSIDVDDENQTASRSFSENVTANATVNAKKRKLDNGTQNEENKLCSTCNIPMAKRRYFLFQMQFKK
ncbi:hypothetical protein BpHYR1_041682 [Brachionus plicatilis]|uniref:Uncharacterized protein n=1 Tax=Brachionus plicatilis TaxID=10195 RepID=A0A3M7ST59_BRAPC|nr:hypothetical protein BpHYR1_041682 [Brachionus plicatilis]